MHSFASSPVRNLALAALCVGAGLGLARAQSCPATDVVKNQDGKSDNIGDKKNLPIDGWYAYVAEDQTAHPGLYTSPLKSFAPTVVPGTDKLGVLFTFAISDDGKWIFFAGSDRTFYAVKRDGSGFTNLTSALAALGTTYTQGGHYCLWRRAPSGKPELAFNPSKSPYLVSAPLDLSGATVQVLEKPRMIIDTNLLSFSGELAMNGNHIWVRASNGASSNPGWNVTIPATGTVKAENVYQSHTAYNCGLTLSPDGTLALGNVGGNVSGVSPGYCTPGQHKGFVILPFKEAPKDAAMAWGDWVVKEAVSVNWAPSAYRDGSFKQQEFHNWYWSNHPDYIIGDQRADDISQDICKVHGLWLVDYKTNQWTLLTENDTHALAPAIYVEGVVVGLKPARAAVPAWDFGAYDLSGRRIDPAQAASDTRLFNRAGALPAAPAGKGK